MVFKKKAKHEQQLDQPPQFPGPPPQHQPAPPVMASPAPVAQDPLDLKGAIEEFNATYSGMFEGEMAGVKALLFACYAELRAIRKQ